MDSTDYLNSAKRAAIVFFLLALGALGAASYGLAVSAWDDPPLAQGPSPKPQESPHRRVGEACSTHCPNLKLAFSEPSERLAP